MNGWGNGTCEWRFDAVKDGKTVISRIRKPARETMVSITADKTLLVEDNTYDVAVIHFEAVDENGNHMPYYQEPLLLKAEGEISIIGPEMITLRGGFGGTYVKSTGKSGCGKLIISGSSLSTELIFDIVKNSN
jgi:beta-galactosidase